MRRWIVGLALICAAGVVLLLLNRTKPSGRIVNENAVQPVTTNEKAVTHSNRVAAGLPVETNATAPAPNAIAAAAGFKAAVTPPPSVAPMPEFTNFAASIVLENMRTVFRNYSATFGGNPVGTNPEITKALDGGNPKQIKFINAEDGLRINGNGELVDSWGTPFFFHQLSGTQMEIHSAGPDHIMWTADDLVVK